LDDGLTAEECVQDSFMKVWLSTAQFDPQRGPFIAWLVGIARNVAIDRLRQRGRQVTIAEPANSKEESDNELLFSLPTDWQEHERVNSLRFAVAALPPDQRQVIELSYYGGMSQSDISETLALPLGTVKTRMRLGMQKLRNAWLQE
jgi:RNA polymerase sigma-70 factor (ECF subfamily)